MDGPRPGPGAGSSVDDVMAHFGVRGMHWGVRRGRSSSSGTDDSKIATASLSKIKTGGTKALTTPELQALVNRMNLEQQYSTMKSKETTKMRQGQKVLKGALATGKTINEVVQFANSPVGKLLRKQLLSAR